MANQAYEIRDPIHVFVRMDRYERHVVDSFQFQRLRHIHQLALSHLVYPGATHRRFEHCLGVMELAGRLYDVVTDPNNLVGLPERSRREIPVGDERQYWRRVVRMAGLCHDLGHLPFSHAAEDELLPDGWDHERLSVALILSDEMRAIWGAMKPPLSPPDVAKLAVGAKKSKHLKAHGISADFNSWEALLSEIIVGDAFGVDRMDYLLRDAYHAGVPAGRVDHFRLIDTLRILPRTVDDSDEPVLGIQHGGLQAAEALLLARYFMYTQVYMHPVRRIYDIHLKDFLKAWLPAGRFSTDINEHLMMTDNEVLTALYKASSDNDSGLNPVARRIIKREHFKEVYRRNPEDENLALEPQKAIFEALQARYGPDSVRGDFYNKAQASPDFPVGTRDGRRMSSLQVSPVLKHIPAVTTDFVFVEPRVRDDARAWLQANRESILSAAAAKPLEN